jgi:hypothetical protein
MKKKLLLTAIAALLLFCVNGLLAQNTQTKLNQIELMKQFIGSWKCDIAKDTAIITDITPFGTIVEENYQIVTKGKILDSGKQLWGYDKESDKLITAQVSISSPNIYIMAFWWISKNIFEGVLFQDISNSENATLKWKIEFKSTDLFSMTTIQNNKVVASHAYTREKR